MLFVSVLVPFIGAAGLFLWRPKNRRLCHLWTMIFTLITSACVASALMNPSVQKITILHVTPLLTVSSSITQSQLATIFEYPVTGASALSSDLSATTT